MHTAIARDTACAIQKEHFVTCICYAERAIAFLKQQQQQLTQSPYAQLKPLALSASKGTLQRLSKLPGWNRQSARKK